MREREGICYDSQGSESLTCSAVSVRVRGMLPRQTLGLCEENKYSTVFIKAVKSSQVMSSHVHWVHLRGIFLI